MSVTQYYNVAVYVGPVHVSHYATQAKAAGYMNVYSGTEHVYCTVSHAVLADETDRLCFRQKVADRVYGSPMAAGWRDVQIVGQI